MWQGVPVAPIRWPDKISRVRWARGGKHVGDEDQVCHFFSLLFCNLFFLLESSSPTLDMRQALVASMWVTKSRCATFLLLFCNLFFLLDPSSPNHDSTHIHKMFIYLFSWFKVM